MFRCMKNRQQNSFVSYYMSMREESLENRKLHLSPKHSASISKWKELKILEGAFNECIAIN